MPELLVNGRRGQAGLKYTRVLPFEFVRRISCHRGNHRVQVFDIAKRIGNDNTSWALFYGNTEFFKFNVGLLAECDIIEYGDKVIFFKTEHRDFKPYFQRFSVELKSFWLTSGSYPSINFKHVRTCLLETWYNF